MTRIYFGHSADLPVPADYAGSGAAGAAVYRPPEGIWAIRGFTRAYWGGAGYISVPVSR